MKKILLLGAAMLALLSMTGCKTLDPGTSDQRADLIAAVTQVGMKNLSLPLLHRNPNVVPALEALAVAIDAVFDGGEIDAQRLREFTDTIGTRFDLDDTERVLIASAIWDVWGLYTAYYGSQVANATDPNVRKVLLALRDGITQGIAFYRAFQPNAEQMALVGARVLP